ncbi:MAG: RNA polymerase sigma factor [Bacteroidota bacterium]
MELSDEKLMSLFRSSGDDDIFTVIYERYFGALCRFLAWQLDEPEHAADLAQNILLRVYQRPQLFDPKRNFKVWLYSIAKNDWKNHLRNKATQQRHSKSAVQHWQQIGTAVPNPNYQPQLQQIHQAMQLLSEQHREVILLKYTHNLSMVEISEVLQCSTGTVKSRLYYALKQLRKFNAVNEKLKL